MDLRDIRYFSVLAEVLHFGRAAERIGISTPGLSAAIRRLEDESGVPLFERLPRGARLTRAGKVLLDGAHRMLEAHAAMITAIRRHAQGDPALRIAHAGWLHDEWMAPVLGLVARREPAARFSPHRVRGHAPEAALLAGELDAAVIVAGPAAFPARGRTLECVPIGEDPAVPIVRLGHPRLRAPDASAAAVWHEEWVAALADPVDEAFDAGAAAAIGAARRVGARVADVAAMIDAVAASDRVGWCPLSVLPFVRDRVEALPGLPGLMVPRTLLLARCTGDDLPGWSELASMLSLRHRMLVGPFMRDGSRFCSGAPAAADAPVVSGETRRSPVRRLPVAQEPDLRAAAGLV